jgi:glycolate oxidase
MRTESFTSLRDSYAPVTPAIVAELAAIVGAPFVLSDSEQIVDYGHDETGTHYRAMPEVVVKPETAEQVAAIMRLANREHIPVTPRGAGSGLSGGAVPMLGGIVLSLERMNHIVEIDRENLMAVVQAGVITDDLNAATRPYGLFYAGYPMSAATCFIGGNVAENAGGGRAVKYGVTGHHVLGVEVVLPMGEIIRLGGKRLKDVTGYDLLHLLIGSEGTLGIFTEVIVRLLPLPAARAVLLAPYADFAAAVRAVPWMMAERHITPSAIEVMDRLSIEMAYRYANERIPHPAAHALLLLEVDGSSTEQVQADVEALADLCMESGALDVYVGDTPAKINQMWRPRQLIAEAVVVLNRTHNSEDLALPPARIAEMLPVIARLSEKYGVLMPSFGHIGDGNLHIETTRPPEMSLETFDALMPDLQDELYRAVVALGGTISGEHGIGMKRTRYLPLALSPTVIDLQRRIKQVFDPLGILNPGKVFPEPETSNE